MSNWLLTVLGSSSSFPPQSESTAALHLTGKKDSILVDAGGNIPRLLADCGFDYRQLTEVLISHSHPDHTYGLPFLSHCFYHGGKKMTCRAPEDTIARLKKKLDAFELEDEVKYLDFVFEPIPVDKPVKFKVDKSLQIQTVPTSHSRPGVGFLFEGPAQNILYTSDTAQNEILLDLEEKLDVLLIDCQATEAYRRYFEDSHCSSLEVGEIAAELKVGSVVPFHYNTTEFPVKREELTAEIRKNYGGTIIFPARGMGFEL